MKDMEFMNMRMFTTQRICASYGVPKVVLNYTDGVNYSNADMQYTKYIDNTIRPRESKFAKMVTELISEIDESILFCFHDDHINDLKEKTEVQIEQVKFGLKTLNEIRQENGDEEYIEEEASKPLISRALVPLDMSGLDDIVINT